MSRGRIVQMGSPASLYERPVSRFVADFIGDNNILQGQVTGHDADEATVRVEGFPPLRAADVRVSVGGSVTLCIRPEKIQVSASPPSGVANVVSGQVERTVYLGSKTHVYAQLAGVGRLLAAVPGIFSTEPVATIAMSWAATDAVPLQDDVAPEATGDAEPAAAVAMR
jgi:ABC-type Fe3+/spermidine/putrescine transport system ATPase subunit